MSTIRPDVMSALLGERRDDRTVARAVANPAELTAAVWYWQEAADYHRHRAADAQRLADIMARYTDDPDVHLEVIRPLMTAAERTEVQEILDRLTPGGRQ